MEWIATKYGVAVVAVLADRIWWGDELDRLRVAVWLESDAEAARFRSDSGNFDPVRQREIGNRVLSELSEGSPIPFVVTQSFAAEARSEAYGRFTPSELNRLRAELAHRLIVAVRIWHHAVVFLQTDAQVEEFAQGAEHARWTDVVWRAIHAKDEFGAVPREGFAITLDSEQNFQENFEGSSYYYFL